MERIRKALALTALCAGLLAGCSCRSSTAPSVPEQASAAPEEVAPLRLVQTIPLEGVRGRIDHMAIDAKARRLYVAALGNDSVEVLDLAAGKWLARIEGVREPQGICVLPESGELVVAGGGDGQVRFYDRDQKLLATISDLDDADNVRYDPQGRLLYVGYGDGALAVIDPAKRAKVADIRLGGHPESFEIEAKGRRIFVNVPGKRHIAVVDREKRTVTDQWPIEKARSNFPMALDEANQRLLVGCRWPAKLLVLDTQSGKTVARPDCCGDADDVFHDAANKRVYVTGGEGCVSVFKQADADSYRPVGKVATASGARTSLFVPESSRLFVAAPLRGRRPAAIQVYETQPRNL